MNILKLIAGLQELSCWGIEEIWFEAGAYGGVFADCPNHIFENRINRREFEESMLEKGWCFDEGTSAIRYNEKN